MFKRKSAPKIRLLFVDENNDLQSNIAFKAPQILHDFGRKENFEKATDDVELYECIKQLVENVGEWCKSTFADPEALKTMVV